MHCHPDNVLTTADCKTAATQPMLVLVGNPNVGKSVLFNKLTGRFVVISNYPGTTVEIARGGALLDDKEFTVLDTPGVNEFAPRTEDARVTCDVLRDYPEATVVQVADAKNLRRALLLTLQLAELRRPMVLVLNLMDELDKCGGRIDVHKLSEILGVPVIPTIAIAGTGVHLLQQSIGKARVPSLPSDVPERRLYPTPIEAQLARANAILAQVYTTARPRHATFAQKLGWWATHPVKGLAIAALVLAFTFWFVGLFGAGTAVGFFEKVVFGRYINPWAIRAADAVLPFPHTHDMQVSHYSLEIPLSPAHGVSIWDNTQIVRAPTYSLAPSATLGWWTQVRRLAHDFLVGEYGVITMALSYALAIVLPIVTTFFLVFSLLEDSGYLSRLAVMLNRLFRSMGLNGKAVLPMVLGLGCDTMATMTTRILETCKERVITTLLLALAVPCSAQLGVLLAMMASISCRAAVFWMILMIVISCIIGWLAAKLYGGGTSNRSRVAANAPAATRQCCGEDICPTRVVPERGHPAVCPRHDGSVRPRQTAFARQDRAVRRTARDGMARAAAGNGERVPHRLFAARLRRRFPARRGDGAETLALAAPSARRHGDDHTVHALHRHVVHDLARTRQEDGVLDHGVYFPVRLSCRRTGESSGRVARALR